ncbi:MAG: hypothetical protein MHM6MM_002659 [Cercozoa sp. M6MM]
MSYVGKYVDVITKRGMRYEGILDAVNLRDQKVQLTQVVCFGTEDRDCETQLPPHDAMLPRVTLARADIAALRTLPDSHVLRVPSVHSRIPKIPETVSENPAQQLQQPPQPQRQRSSQSKQQQQKPRRTRKKRSKSGQKNTEQPAVAFDPSVGFFDTLAEGEPREVRPSFHRQRQMDLETFGEIANTHQSGTQMQQQQRRKTRPRRRTNRNADASKQVSGSANADTAALTNEGSDKRRRRRRPRRRRSQQQQS